MRDGQMNSSHIEERRPGNRYVAKSLIYGVSSGALVGIVLIVLPSLSSIAPGVIFGFAVYLRMLECNVPTRGYAFVATIAFATLSWLFTIGANIEPTFPIPTFEGCTRVNRFFLFDVVCALLTKSEPFLDMVMSYLDTVMSQLGWQSSSLFGAKFGQGVFLSGLLGLAIFFPAFFVAWRLPSPQWRSLGVLFLFGSAGSVLTALFAVSVPALAIVGIFGPFQIIWQTMLLVGVGFVVDRWGSPPPAAN